MPPPCMHVPVRPVFMIDMTAFWELKLTSAKEPRLLSVSTWPVMMLTGDCPPPPQNAPGMLDHSVGVFSVGGERERQRAIEDSTACLECTRHAVWPCRGWLLLTTAIVAPPWVFSFTQHAADPHCKRNTYTSARPGVFQRSLQKRRNRLKRWKTCLKSLKFYK